MKFAAASRAHDFAAGETLARAQAASAYSLFLAGGAKVSNASGSYQDLEVLPAPGVGVARFPSPSPMATGVFPGARGRRARSGRAQRSSNAGGLNEVPRAPSRGTEVARSCPAATAAGTAAGSPAATDLPQPAPACSPWRSSCSVSTPALDVPAAFAVRTSTIRPYCEAAA